MANPNFGDEFFGTGLFGGGVPPVFEPPGLVMFTFRELRVHAEIDGRSVLLTDWNADSTVNWGYRTLTGAIEEAVTWAEQEAPIRLWLSDDTELWAGKLALDPTSERGIRNIRAEGYASDIAAATTRMFYRIDGAEKWSDKEEDPFNGTNNDKYDLVQRRGMLKWKMFNAGPDAFVANDQAGFVIWVEGGLITRYEFVSATGAAYTAFDLQVQRKTGPTGANTTIATHSLNIGAPVTRAGNISSPEDALIFRVVANTGAAADVRRWTTAKQIKVYGRTNDDGFSASEVVADVGADAGFDTALVQSNALSVLPLDWTEDHTGLLDYMADLADWHWEAVGPVVGVPRLTFGPWEETWTGYQAHGIAPTWESQKRFNRVRVPFTYVSGASGEAIATADPDPFPGREVTYPADELEHPQQNKSLATAAATNQAPFWASKRVAGRMQIGQVRDSHGEPSSGYKVRPGSVIDVADREDLGPQRIVGVTYREREDVVADINADFNVIRLLDQLRRSKPKKKKGGKKK